MNGGDRIAGVLDRHGVRFLYTLCGGHISPILVGAKRRGIRVVDVRHEATAVFAADATARLTGIPGVAAVTAGPGVTNTITAVKNAQLAQSPVLVLGGATGTILKGRGALQDIDQIALFAPHVKWATTVRRVRDLVPVVERALWIAREGVPGPVFVECPVDLLYDRELVESMYGAKGGKGGGLGGRLLNLYLKRHVGQLFAGAGKVRRSEPAELRPPKSAGWKVSRAAWRLRRARRPVLMLGSQATLEVGEIERLAAAVERLGLPVYLSGMARGLLGRGHPLQRRHKRRQALKEADLVILAGVPCDFRLDYGRQISRGACVIAVNRSLDEARKNRRPWLAVEGDPALFVRALSRRRRGESDRTEWLERLERRDLEREAEIDRLAAEPDDLCNPVAVCREIDRALTDDAVLVADGGDFVATASYTTSPRSPLSWLDPGVFGTLGVGAGFALGAKLCRADAAVWIFYGDGSSAYSLTEFDTFVRHGIPVVAVVGNDASWAQIARDQVEILGDDVGTVLRRSDYHLVAEALGGKGFKVESTEALPQVLRVARDLATEGHAVLVNVLLGRTDFRKGSISI